MARKETGITVTQVGYSSGTVTVSNGMVYIPLASANTIYTDSLYIGDNMMLSNVGCATVMNGVLGSANVVLTLEESWRKPAIEGSFDITYVAVQTVNMLTVGTWGYTALLSASNASIVPYIRFKAVGTLLNTSSTVNVVVMEQVSG
jgi:hypothetical protein